MYTIATNKLATHKSYPKILAAYNELLKEKGKVNNKKFYEQVILPEIPDYCMASWYQFLRRFKTEAGLVVATVRNRSEMKPSTNVAVESDLKHTMLSNQQATAKFIQAALNIGAERAAQILENPQLLSAKEALQISVQAMKAQDSRIHAVGKIREDNREQEKFDRTFDSANFE